MLAILAQRVSSCCDFVSYQRRLDAFRGNLVQRSQRGKIMFEVFDHTADLGLRVRADDLNSLFAEAARALMSVVVSNPDAVEPRDALAIDISGGDREYLLVDWLDKMLFLFESKRFLASRFDVAVAPDGVSAAVRGEPYDEARHTLAHEVKAITYHGLKVEQTKSGWLAEVILDI
jgi:SHS2 domain-containing protein